MGGNRCMLSAGILIRLGAIDAVAEVPVRACLCGRIRHVAYHGGAGVGVEADYKRHAAYPANLGTIEKTVFLRALYFRHGANFAIRRSYQFLLPAFPARFPLGSLWENTVRLARRSSWQAMPI